VAIDLNELMKFLNDHSYGVYFEREPLSITAFHKRMTKLRMKIPNKRRAFIYLCMIGYSILFYFILLKIFT